MSDLEMRKGYRAMVAGGLASMDDEEISILIEAGRKALTDRSPEFLSKDAEYLQKYMAICENFIGAEVSKAAGEEQVTELNKEFKDLISPKTLKSCLICPGGIYAITKEDCETEEEWENIDEYERDGWMPSSIC